MRLLIVEDEPSLGQQLRNKLGGAGYAVDLGDGDDPATNLSTSFEQTYAFSWLQDHAASYHFTLSFPAVNSQGVSYEPWHWRFEGSADALRRFEPARRLANGG